MRKLILATTIATFALTPGTASAVDVCNEAENSWRGGYDITMTDDPNPPAFLRGSQMELGNGDGAGLVNAAEHSPSKVVCTANPSDNGDDNGSGLPPT